MNRLRTAAGIAALASLLLAAGCNLLPSAAPVGQTMAATARLSGSSEVPPLQGAGSGTLDATLDTRTRLLSWTVTHAGLSGPVTAAHFHGPSLVGQNGPVVVPMTGSLVSPIKGEATLSSAQVADLMAGRWYLNLHTAANPGGEVRGQVAVLQ